MVAKQRRPLVVLVGETASGKSNLSLQLAQRINGEIICADAYTTRRGVDIGTAKPTHEQRRLIQHYLVDIIEPNDGYSAARFKLAANNAMDEIYKKDKLPIMVGGSGLYIDSILYDYEFLDKPNPRLRKELNSLSIDELVKRLEKTGFDTEGVDLKNKHRIVRLIESGQRLANNRSLRENTYIIGLNVGKEQLKKNIISRIEHMMKAGLEDEVSRLSSDFGWEAEALKAIGYREWKDYFEGSKSKESVIEDIKKDSLDLAKKQRTWFKRNKSIHWIDTPVDLDKIVVTISTFLKTKSS
jgi:tRNA dimethylallyltransferase